MSRNSLRDALGIDLPIIQAPMAGAQDHRLALAVCGVGALGSVPAAMLGAAALRDELQLLMKGTDQPFNVNFFCHVPTVFDSERDARWRRALQPYYNELGIEPPEAGAAPGRAPFDSAMADVLEEFRPAVASFHFGLPAPHLLARVRQSCRVILSSATTVDEARWLEANGVDVIIAQGTEAGGHRGHFLSADLSGQQPAPALLQDVLRAVRVPVVAAGGIADAGDVDRALRAGAAGVQVGTSYLLCPEATTSAVHRHALTNDEPPATALTNLFSGRPARGLVNRLMQDLGPMSDLPPEFPHASVALAPLRAAAERAGRGDYSPLWAGERFAACRAIPAAMVTEQLAPD